MTAWAPVAVRVGGAEEVLGDLERIRVGLSGAQAVGQMRALADAEDCTARLLASQETGAGMPNAAAMARQAAERYAEIGDVAPAAHAFWLAGQLLRGADQIDDAVWNFESAAEGFALAHDRARRSEVVGELVTLLRATGQDLRAEEAVASLAPRPFTN